MGKNFGGGFRKIHFHSQKLKQPSDLNRNFFIQEEENRLGKFKQRI